MEFTESVKARVKAMSLRDKVGQCFVIGFTGSMLTPAIANRIKEMRPAGIRVGMNFRIKSAYYDPYSTGEKYAHRALRAPTGTVKDFLTGLPAPYVTCEEYAAFLNEMKQMALENPASIPLHVTFDMEGDMSADFPRRPLRFFPSLGGLASTGNTELAEQVGWATAVQMAAMGFNWIHSPVLDVNTDPMNPEIGTRSAGANPADASRYGVALYKGIEKAGVIATAKHFPGRGHSIGDAHHGLPLVDLDREALELHIAPFKEAIAAGVPSVMTAHTSYPALDPSMEPASLSYPIITDFLKGELGFEGVVTSDDITMGAILEKYEVHQAVTKAIQAGTDLILLRDESVLIDEVFEKVYDAADRGNIEQSRLDDAVGRVLTIKERFGLFTNGGIVEAVNAESGARDSEVIHIAKKSAEAVTSVLRDRNRILPLNPDQRVLLVEQANVLHKHVNSQECHPGILWKAMLAQNENVAMVETEMSFAENDFERIERRLDEADVVVITNYYFRRGACGHEFVKTLHQKINKPIVVVTNTELPLSVDDCFETVVLSYGSSPECIKAVAEAVYGVGASVEVAELGT